MQDKERMKMNTDFVRTAYEGESRRILDFYYELLDDMQTSEYVSKWVKGVYPVLSDIESAVSDGNLFLAEEDYRIIGAFILNHDQDPLYADVDWKYRAEPDRVAVIHLLATAYARQGEGVGRRLLSSAIEISRDRGDGVIRLDTLTWNIPGQKLYEGFGFRCCGDYNMDYPTTGLIPFRMYELRL